MIGWDGYPTPAASSAVWIFHSVRAEPMISSVSSIRFTVLMPRRRLRYLEASDTRRTRRRRRTRPVAKPPETLQMLLQPMQRTKSKPLARQTVVTTHSLTSVLGVSSFGSSGM